MNTTFQNSAQVLSIGIFFTLMIVGLMTSLPQHLLAGLTAHGVPTSVAERVAHLSPVSTLFAAFLGYDPVQSLLGAHSLSHLTVAQQHALVGRSFFPGLISQPFREGLHAALDFAIVASLLAAGASWLRGGRYVYSEEGDPPASSGGADGTDSNGWAGTGSGSEESAARNGAGAAATPAGQAGVDGAPRSPVPVGAAGSDLAGSARTGSQPGVNP